MSFAIVSDIHGEAARLETLLSSTEFEGRHAIFLGDYVNRGPQTKDVLDLLINFSERVESTFLWGNHEVALVRFLRKGDFFRFSKMGGIPTIRSYISKIDTDVHGSFKAQFPVAHRSFLSNLRRSFETPEFLASHTGYDPFDPGCRQFRTLVLDSHPELFSKQNRGNKLAVCGHYTQPGFKPFVSPGLICIETGAGLGGRLCCLLLPEKRFIFA